MRELLVRQAQLNAALDPDKTRNKSRQRRRITKLRGKFSRHRQSLRETNGIPHRA